MNVQRVDAREYEVVVCGGGLAGTFAAIASAREGARTVLVEQYGFLGGMATLVPVSLFMQYHVMRTDGQVRQLVFGLFEEAVRRLKAGGMMLDKPFSFDDIALRGVLDDMVGEAGVDVRFHTFLAGAAVAEGRVTAVRCAGKSGLRDLRARVFIDCTGDGDLAHHAGVECAIGGEDGRIQPMTPTFILGGIDLAQLPPKPEINRRLREAFDRKESPIYEFGFWRTPHPGMVLCNSGHIWGRNALDEADLSRAEVDGRRLVRGIVDALRRFVPGFENCYAARLGAQIGVRETRHIRGRYTLTEEDVLAGRKFDDGVARNAFEIDVHPPKPGQPKRNHVLGRGVYYEVPYRCLLPAKGPANLLVACRALSATHPAHASLRTMPTMSAVGEAAGIAAARALANGGDVGRVDGAALKRDLLARGIMGEPEG